MEKCESSEDVAIRRNKTNKQILQMQANCTKKAGKYFSRLKSISYMRNRWEAYLVLADTAILFSLIRALLPLLSLRK